MSILRCSIVARTESECLYSCKSVSVYVHGKRETSTQIFWMPPPLPKLIIGIMKAASKGKKRRIYVTGTGTPKRKPSESSQRPKTSNNKAKRPGKGKYGASTPRYENVDGVDLERFRELGTLTEN